MKVLLEEVWRVGILHKEGFSFQFLFPGIFSTAKNVVTTTCLHQVRGGERSETSLHRENKSRGEVGGSRGVSTLIPSLTSPL